MDLLKRLHNSLLHDAGQFVRPPASKRARSDGQQVGPIAPNQLLPSGAVATPRGFQKPGALEGLLRHGTHSIDASSVLVCHRRLPLSCQRPAAREKSATRKTATLVLHMDTVFKISDNANDARQAIRKSRRHCRKTCRSSRAENSLSPERFEAQREPRLLTIASFRLRSITKKTPFFRNNPLCPCGVNRPLRMVSIRLAGLPGPTTRAKHSTRFIIGLAVRPFDPPRNSLKIPWPGRQESHRQVGPWPMNGRRFVVDASPPLVRIARLMSGIRARDHPSAFTPGGRVFHQDTPNHPGST